MTARSDSPVRVRRHLLSLADVDGDELRELVVQTTAHAADAANGVPPAQTLRGTVIGVYFRRTSTRTRTAFTTGALRLGASVIAYGPDDLQENTGETSEDTGAVLSRMLDGLVARTAGPPEELRAWASQSRMSVINAMTSDEHPTQALGDLATVLQCLGTIDGVRMLYVGEGNNTAAALALALTRFPGAELHVRTPRGYGLMPEQAAAAAAYAERYGAVFVEGCSPDDLPEAVDVVYTTRWQTTGTTKADRNWREDFEPFRVDDALMERYPGAIFMHDLPAHRGEEVTASVLDGPASVAFQQAENKLYSAMATLEWCFGT